MSPKKPPPRHNNQHTPWLHRPSVLYPDKKACVIGAGIAGASIARQLALRGWQITVLEAATVASGASGNPAAVLYPPSFNAAPTQNPLNDFAQHAWPFALREFNALPPAENIWQRCGVMQLLAGHQARKKNHHAPHFLNAADAAEKAGITLSALELSPEYGALWHGDAGWINAAAYCRYLLNHPNIAVHEHTAVQRIARPPDHQNEHQNEHQQQQAQEQQAPPWQLFNTSGTMLHKSPVVIIANGHAATHLSLTAHLPLHAVRGQISALPTNPPFSALRCVICHDGFLTPALPDGRHYFGATFTPNDEARDIRAEDHAHNARSLQEFLPSAAPFIAAAAPEHWQGRAAVRCQSPDYLPLVGPVACAQAFQQHYAGLRDGKLLAYPLLPALHGLYVSVAYGAKGFSQAGFAAAILAAEINQEPPPASRTLLNALHPMRFAARDLKRTPRVKPPLTPALSPSMGRGS